MERNRFSILTILLVTLVLILSLSFSTYSPTDRRLLVLLDDLSLKSSHSIFFNSIKSRGFNLDFKLADDPKLALQRYDQYLYDGLILFSPSIRRFGGALDLALATGCGVDFDDADVEFMMH
ncbi:hypothetical protein POPTR_004G157900v4 [Populus trichocarpa]|uniref:Dolichyl-diphosphooligosaccharide--protein glycosyltransferase 48 kDa subunit n=1 Tax=Populus trichocarpa TaxID=3694 RepID=A0A2K2AVD4_POPTR|nr:hypothetical protein POPTR_004G157900v4 [Populus trichocarpa]